MKDDGAPEAAKEASGANPGAEADSKLINQADSTAVEKEVNNNSISQSQLLWVKGAAKNDADMLDDDDDQDEQSSEGQEHIDPELKKKCLQAQDPDKLFTLNINTYKVCQLNTLLSNLGFRLEPKEQVLQAIRRRE